MSAVHGLWLSGDAVELNAVGIAAAWAICRQHATCCSVVRAGAACGPRAELQADMRAARKLQARPTKRSGRSDNQGQEASRCAHKRGRGQARGALGKRQPLPAAHLRRCTAAAKEPLATALPGCMQSNAEARPYQPQLWQAMGDGCQVCRPRNQTRVRCPHGTRSNPHTSSSHSPASFPACKYLETPSKPCQHALPLHQAPAHYFIAKGHKWSLLARPRFPCMQP